jgi:hypothetical protein
LSQFLLSWPVQHHIFSFLFFQQLAWPSLVLLQPSSCLALAFFLQFPLPSSVEQYILLQEQLFSCPPVPCFSTAAFLAISVPIHLV